MSGPGFQPILDVPEARRDWFALVQTFPDGSQGLFGFVDDTGRMLPALTGREDQLRHIFGPPADDAGPRYGWKLRMIRLQEVEELWRNDVDPVVRMKGKVPPPDALSPFGIVDDSSWDQLCAVAWPLAGSIQGLVVDRTPSVQVAIVALLECAAWLAIGGSNRAEGRDFLPFMPDAWERVVANVFQRMKGEGIIAPDDALEVKPS
jgi:hypothetical protein